MDLTVKGASVFFFPEGTRSKDGKLGAFKVSSYNVLIIFVDCFGKFIQGTQSKGGKVGAFSLFFFFFEKDALRGNLEPQYFLGNLLFYLAGDMQKGAFSVAAKTKVPVVPITLMGTGKIMPSGMEGILNEGYVKVVIHKPIEGSDAQVLCNEARNTIADELNRQ